MSKFVWNFINAFPKTLTENMMRPSSSATLAFRANMQTDDYIEFVPKSYPKNLLKKDWTKRKCHYLKFGIDFMHKLHDMEVRHDDVWLVTLPKSGTTWMQELLWLVINDFDFEGAKKEDLEFRSPYLEFDYEINMDMMTAFKPVENLKSPRLIKSHLPLPMLPKQVWSEKPKLIYVYRNPKDALVSFYYHNRAIGFEMDKTCEEYCNDYVDNGCKVYSPFDHVTEFYALRQEPWVLYTSYERMKLNLHKVIMDVCTFLGKSITESQMEQMLQHLSFENMKSNPKTNLLWTFERARQMLNKKYDSYRFVRKGKVGGYKDELSPEFINKCDKWIEAELKPYNVTLDELL